MAKQHIPGLALPMSRKGVPIRAQGFGQASLELNVSASYGFGWFVESQNGHRVVEHEGRWQGFESQISRYLDDGLTVVVLVNSGTCDPHLIADEVEIGRASCRERV